MSLSQIDQRPAADRPDPPAGLVSRAQPSTARPANTHGRKGPAWWRWLRRGIEVSLVSAGVYALYNQRHQVAQASHLLAHLHWPWVGAAMGTEIASMVCFARLQRWLLRAGGADLGLGAMVEITLAGNAMSVSLPGGAAWSASFAFEQLRRRGAERTLAVWVILVAGALSSFALFVLGVAGIEEAGSVGPAAGLRLPALAVAAIPVVVAALAVVARHSRRARRAGLAAWDHLRRDLPHGERVSGALASLGTRLRAVQPRRRDWAGSFGLALLNWAYDGATLAFSMLALGFAIPWRGLLVAYTLAQLSASLPITPGGIGVVEGSLSFALIAYGLPAKQAVAAALLYRIISFWGLVPVGWGSWGWLALQQRRRPEHPHHPWAWHHGAPAH